MNTSLSPHFPFTYQATVELLAGDVRAIGAAVTVALCGHWEHDGPCRWPHLTTTESAQNRIAVHVSYDCADNERADVESIIAGAISSGVLATPVHEATTWRVLS